MPVYAPISRTTLPTIASNTGWTSVCDRLMTRRMSRWWRSGCPARCGQLAVARLQLGEEPDVLDGDHRLVGEGLEEGRPADVGEEVGFGPHAKAGIAPMATPRASTGTFRAVRKPAGSAFWKLTGNRPIWLPACQRRALSGLPTLPHPRRSHRLNGRAVSEGIAPVPSSHTQSAPALGKKMETSGASQRWAAAFSDSIEHRLDVCGGTCDHS